MNIFKYKRKSSIEIGDMFFWDVVINQKQKLLLGDRYKDVIINSWEFLSPYTRVSNNSISTIHLIADKIKKKNIFGV